MHDGAPEGLSLRRAERGRRWAPNRVLRAQQGTDTIRAEIHGTAAWPEPPRVPMKL